ncbi:lipid II:glycine glycyltransferase FemX [Natrialbaceae archaeon A-gly3]
MTVEVFWIDSLDAVNRNQWNQVVEQSPLGTVYHRYGWLEAVEHGTDHEPRHLVVSKKGNPIAIFPNFVTTFGPVRRLTSIAPGFGGPVVMTDEEESLTRLLEAVTDVRERTIVSNQLRTYGQDYVRYNDLLTDYGYDLRVEWCRFVLDLDRGVDELFADMDSERRRGIRRGHDQDVDIVDEELTGRALSRFYDNYATVMDRVGQPDVPRSFFLELGEFDERVKLFSLEVEGTDCGSFLYLLDDERSTIHHAFTGVTREHLEYHAAELLHEHAIKWGIEHGYETYDLRGARTDFRDGVFRFKEDFGARAVPLLTWERGFPTPILPVMNVGRSLYHQFRS